MKTGALDRYVDKLVRNKASAQLLETIEMQRAGKLAYKQINQVGADPILNTDGIIAVDETLIDGSPNFRQQCVIDSYDKLLLHLDNNVTDSATGKTVTNNNVTFSTSSKLGTHCGVFNGTNAYLSLADSDDWYFGGGCFTVDFWIKWNAFSGFEATGMVGQYVDLSNFWQVYRTFSGDLRLWFIIGGVTKADYTVAWTPSLSTWYHIAAVRDGGNVYLFIDGVSQTLTVGTAISTNNVGNIAATLDIGRFGATNWLNGWMDEVRIVKGVSRWTSNFTPPAQPYPCMGSVNSKGIATERVPKKVGVVVKLDQNDATVTASVARDVDNYTKLLMHGECFKDEIGKAVTAYGDVLVDTTVYKLGYGSIRFSNSLVATNYLELPKSSDWNIGVDKYTIDFWVRYNSISFTESNMTFCELYESGTTEWIFVLLNTGGSYYLRFEYYISGSEYFDFRIPWTPSINTWYHIAVVKDGHDYKFYVNGTQQGATQSTSITPRQMNATLTIGGKYYYSLNGWMDEFRWSSGIARWSGTFTPPTSPYVLGNYVSAPLTQIGSTGYYRSDLTDVSAQPSGQSVSAKVNFYSSVAKCQGIGVYYR